MWNYLIIAGAVILLGGLLFFESKEMKIGILLTKTPLSLLFIAAVMLQPHPDQWYFHFLFIGLVFCFFGDVFLALKTEKMFTVGLIAFLAGHVFYIAGFVYLTPLAAWLSYGTLIIFIFSTGVFLFFRPHLRDMTLPVLFYIIVISLMLSGALAVLLTAPASQTARIMVFAGALVFYLSDLFVARNRFLVREPLNHFIGKPLYYVGQFLLAFSVAVISTKI